MTLLKSPRYCTLLNPSTCTINATTKTFPFDWDKYSKIDEAEILVSASKSDYKPRQSRLLYRKDLEGLSRSKFKFDFKNIASFSLFDEGEKANNNYDPKFNVECTFSHGQVIVKKGCTPAFPINNRKIRVAKHEEVMFNIIAGMVNRLPTLGIQKDWVFKKKILLLQIKTLKP